MGNFCSRPEAAIQPTKRFPPCANDKNPVFTPSFQCLDHNLCQECEIKSYHKKLCIICYRHLTSEELEKLQALAAKPCKSCSLPKISTIKRFCGCLLCAECEENFKSKCKSVCQVCCRALEDKINLEKTSESPPNSCIICFTEYSRDQMITLDCDHFFCQDCLRGHIQTFLTDRRQEIVKGIKCFACPGIINDFVIQYLLSAEEFDKYNKIMLSRMITECPKCKNQFSSDVSKIECNNCHYFFCITCKRKGNECTCDNPEELKLEFGDLSACPGCKTLFAKDEGCDHVKCGNEDCGVEYCFSCSAFRSPTMEHGNHYHRPSCPFYSDYDGNDDKYQEKCERCKFEGKLCKRPKNLKIPKKFSPGEF